MNINKLGDSAKILAALTVTVAAIEPLILRIEKPSCQTLRTVYALATEALKTFEEDK